MSWLHGGVARLRLLVSRRASESRFDSEIKFHVEMETERLVRELALDPAEARRRALVAFGGVEKHREELRDGRGNAWFGALSVDTKLGFRMLTKYPGLTMVGLLGISVAVAVGVSAFTAVRAITSAALPVAEGERVVTIVNRDSKANHNVYRTHLHSLALWRQSLQSVDNIGAYRLSQRNIIPADGIPGSVNVAEMTASGFRLARIAPIRGRYLRDEDERAGARRGAPCKSSRRRRLEVTSRCRLRPKIRPHQGAKVTH